LLMTQAQSRTALLAAVTTLVVYPMLRYRHLWQRVLVPSALALVLLATLAVRGADALVGTGSSLLLLDDKYRGSESGLGGRVDQLPVALGMVAERPFLGYGYHVQDTYLPTEALIRVGAFHNGYIGLVVEIGFLGALPVFCLIGLAVVSLWKKASSSNLHAVEFSLVAGYLIYCLAQPYLINQTNPASALFWCIVCGALVENQLYRKHHLPEVNQLRSGLTHQVCSTERRAPLSA
jgi:O-antigen ligase